MEVQLRPTLAGQLLQMIENCMDPRQQGNAEPPITIIHVVESFAGGVRSAVLQYIASTPEIRHVVLASYRSERRPSSQSGYILVDMVPGLIGRIRQIRHLVRAFRADIVHAHSSFGGLYARVLDVGVPVIYTPHCYSFERKDIGGPKAGFFRLIERTLARRTSLVAACSFGEAELARMLGCAACVVPNVGQFENLKNLQPSHDRTAIRIVFCGRISPQKDPAFAIAFVKAFRELCRGPSEFVWIGDGDERLRKRLEAASVTVTGWLGRDEAATEMLRSRLYVHTALWEGFPMSVLEASQLGVPTVVRRIGAMRGMPRDYQAEDPQELAETALAVLASDLSLRSCLSEWRTALDRNCRAVQRACLMRAYIRVSATDVAGKKSLESYGS